jgi:hypothetical protein
MTQTIVIGAGSETKHAKKIEFSYYLRYPSPQKNSVEAVLSSPEQYQYLELICRDYNGGFDLIFAYNNPNRRKDGILYIGHWNDGVV